MLMEISEASSQTRTPSWEGQQGSFNSQGDYNRVNLSTFLEQQGVPESTEALILIRALANRFPISIDGGAWIAGGSVLAMMDQRSMVDRDIDMFFAGPAQADEMEGVLKRSVGFTDRHQTGNATTLTLSAPPFQQAKVQIIRREYFGKVTDVLSTFDFSICQWATDGDTIVYSTQALEDWKTKTLRHVLKKREPDSVDRLSKYSMAGYTPTVESAAMILEWLIDDKAFFVPADGYP